MRFVHAVPTHYFQLKKNIHSWTHGIYKVSYNTDCLSLLYIKPSRHDKDSGLLGHNACMWLQISWTVWRNVSHSSSRADSPNVTLQQLKLQSLWGTSWVLQTQIAASPVWQLDITRQCSLPSIYQVTMDLNPLKTKETRTSYLAMQHCIQEEQNPWLQCCTNLKTYKIWQVFLI
jgi:hypothetical protein